MHGTNVSRHFGTSSKDKICIIISHRSIKNLKLTKTIRLQDGSIR